MPQGGPREPTALHAHVCMLRLAWGSHLPRMFQGHKGLQRSRRRCWVPRTPAPGPAFPEHPGFGDWCLHPSPQPWCKERQDATGGQGRGLWAGDTGYYSCQTALRCNGKSARRSPC